MEHFRRAEYYRLNAFTAAAEMASIILAAFSSSEERLGSTEGEDKNKHPTVMGDPHEFSKG